MKEYRRARFIELLKTRFKGDRAELAKAAKLTNGRLTQLLDPEEPFGDTAARRLVDKLGLPAGYFDHANVDIPLPMPSVEALKKAEEWDKMTAHERIKFDQALALALDTDMEELRLRERNMDTGFNDDLDKPESPSDKPTGTK